jgi:hypothetical protein
MPPSPLTMVIFSGWLAAGWAAYRALTSRFGFNEPLREIEFGADYAPGRGQSKNGAEKIEVLHQEALRRRDEILSPRPLKFLKRQIVIGTYVGIFL